MKIKITLLVCIVIVSGVLLLRLANPVRKSIDYQIISIHEHFDMLAKKNGDMSYLNILGKDFSYILINEQSSRFAAALKVNNIGRGDNVGLFIPNLPQYVITFFGILKAGASVVPI